MNAVEKELILIHEKWMQAVEKYPQKFVFRILGEKHEVNLFEAYAKKQLTENPMSEDTFLIHYQEFENKESYAGVLIDEWKDSYNKWRTTQTNAPEWKDIPYSKKGETDAYKIIPELKELLAMYPYMLDNYLFLFLNPIKAEKVNDFILFIEELQNDLSKEKIKEKIKVVIADFKNTPLFNNKEYTQDIELDINLHNLAKDSMSGGGGSNEASNDEMLNKASFRDFMLLASERMSKQQYEEALILTNRAIKLAVREKMTDAEAHARVTKAQLHMALNQRELSEQEYEIALQLPNLQNKVRIVVAVSYVGLLWQLRKEEKAIQLLEKTEKECREMKDFHMQIECNRMLGQFYGVKNNSNESVRYYQKAIEIGENIEDKEQIKNTSLAYIGVLLLELLPYGSPEYANYQYKMNNLLGENWEEKVIVQKQYA